MPLPDEGARCSGSTSVSKTEGAGSIPAAPAKEPGYCATCGTTSLGDFNGCSGDCWWVNVGEEEPRRAA